MLQNAVTLTPLDLSNEEQVKWLFTVRSNPEVDHYLLSGPPISFDEHVTFLNRTRNERAFFIIAHQGEMAGYCHWVEKEEEVELGWALHPDFWGKGIGKRSVHLLLEELKNRQSARDRKVTLYVLKSNPRASSLYKKCGFSMIEEDSRGCKMEFSQDLPEG